MLLSRTTPQTLSRVSFGATCHSAYTYDGPPSAVFFTHASRSHITFTISTGIPYQLILGSRRPTCTNHSLRLSFDIRFWGLVRPHIFPLFIPEEQLMFCCSLTTCTDQTSTDIFGAENSSVLRTSFIADTYRCASSYGVLRRNTGN